MADVDVPESVAGGVELRMQTVFMPARRVTLSELFWCFLKLGCVSFGGPVAHLGFFQTEFVQRRKWLSDADYADLVALCQFLPGPASSQVGYAIGLREGGFVGGLLAWVGFTLPSAVLMIGFALGVATLGDVGQAGWVVGLKLAAVAVVVQAIWGMAVKLCPDVPRAGLALAATVLLVATEGAGWQVVAILAGALAGWILFRGHTAERSSAVTAASESVVLPGWIWLTGFFALLVGLPLLVGAGVGGEGLLVFDGFYRAGALVFGGGHVVLPLLDAFTVGRGWVDPEIFLAGYGAAQALPGPLFAFSSFLGASISTGPGGIAGGVLALVAIYVPSWLLVLGAMPYWERLRHLPAAQAALRGTNAAVVGLLVAALIDPIWPAAMTSTRRIAFAAMAFVGLKFTKLPPWAVVLVCGGAGALLF